MKSVILWMILSSAAAMNLKNWKGFQEISCADVDCLPGRECVMREGLPQCQCLAICPDHWSPVCGTDGQSYDNHCLLHRNACVTGTHISADSKGYCKKGTKKAKKAKNVQRKMDTVNTLAHEPVTCLSEERDRLHTSVVTHWLSTLSLQSWYDEGMTYREGLWGRFFTCDHDANSYLESDELFNCTSTATFKTQQLQERELIRALCVDALLDSGDSNQDYRLDFEEFITLFQPDFKPPTKMCSLEGRKYMDGEKINVDCNHCTCGMGQWSCASQGCSGKGSELQILSFQNLDDYDDDDETDISDKKDDVMDFNDEKTDLFDNNDDVTNDHDILDFIKSDPDFKDFTKNYVKNKDFSKKYSKTKDSTKKSFKPKDLNKKSFSSKDVKIEVKKTPKYTDELDFDDDGTDLDFEDDLTDKLDNDNLLDSDLEDDDDKVVDELDDDLDDFLSDAGKKETVSNIKGTLKTIQQLEDHYNHVLSKLLKDEDSYANDL